MLSSSSASFPWSLDPTPYQWRTESCLESSKVLKVLKLNWQVSATFLFCMFVIWSGDKLLNFWKKLKKRGCGLGTSFRGSTFISFSWRHKKKLFWECLKNRSTNTMIWPHLTFSELLSSKSRKVWCSGTEGCRAESKCLRDTWRICKQWSGPRTLRFFCSWKRPKRTFLSDTSYMLWYVVIGG